MANEDKRERLIETALEMFTERGCSGVTMDDIAQASHISKRTLYETFANKEELLSECMELVHRRTMETHKKMNAQVDEPMLAAMYMMREGTLVNWRYQLLLQESLRYYPEIHERFCTMHTDTLKNMLYKGFEYMSQHNYLRNSIDVDVAVDFLCRFMQHYKPVEKENYEAHVRRKNEICFTFLRGTMNAEAITRYESEEGHFRSVMQELGLTDKDNNNTNR